MSPAAGDEGDDDVGGLLVEVLASVVVDCGGSRLGVTSGDLDLPQRDAGIEARMMNPARSMCG